MQTRDWTVELKGDDEVTDKVIALLKQIPPGWWGQVQIDYQDGQPVVVRRSETLKLRSDEDNKRHANRSATKF